MAEFDPDRSPVDAFNPYAPPEASLDEDLGSLALSPDLARAEAIRRQYLNHEASVKSVGSLHFLAALFCGLCVMVGIVYAFNGGEQTERVFLLMAAVFYGGLTALNVAVGFGLRELKPWARWTVVVMTSLSMASSMLYIGVVLVVSASTPITAVVPALAMLFLGYILYLLLSPKGAMVFSPEYRQVIDQTPHIKYKISCLLKFFAGLLVAIFLLGLFSFLVSLGMKR